jgi:hypothetical protein
MPDKPTSALDLDAVPVTPAAAAAEDFDLRAAWLKRFQSDAAGNLHAFALRLHEAMPERVTIQESKGFFSRRSTITGVTIAMDQHHYVLELAHGRLKASVALVVRNIALSTRQIDPAQWFAQLDAETRQLSDYAKGLAQSLSTFMADW